MKEAESGKDSNVLRKTPEEIKKGLEPCELARDNFCDYCACDYRCKNEADALEYIQQLESRLAQVERERDAAIKDLSDRCLYCKHVANGVQTGTCRTCFQRRGKHLWAPMVRGNFEWRGICPENTKEVP